LPTRSSDTELLVDTSVAVALLVADHEHHAATVHAIGDRRIDLAGHAIFETYSMLTRMPPPTRRSATAVSRLLGETFPQRCFLSPRAAAGLLQRLARLQIAGDAVYDALVGAAAIEHGVKLATRDRRALATYRALEAEIEGWSMTEPLG
jgi:predicted nucleic acid-binding protein